MLKERVSSIDIRFIRPWLYSSVRILIHPSMILGVFSKKSNFLEKIPHMFLVIYTHHHPRDVDDVPLVFASRDFCNDEIFSECSDDETGPIAKSPTRINVFRMMTASTFIFSNGWEFRRRRRSWELRSGNLQFLQGRQSRSYRSFCTRTAYWTCIWWSDCWFVSNHRSSDKE